MMNDAISLAESFIIREAVRADLAQCAHIVSSWIRETPWMPERFTTDEIEGMMVRAKESGRTILAAEQGGRVYAYLSMDGDGFVHAIYLDANIRGRGIGKRLLNEAKRRSDSLELTVFEENAAARRFYEREGFVRVPDGRTFNSEEGLHSLRMRWRGAAL